MLFIWKDWFCCNSSKCTRSRSSTSTCMLRHMKTTYFWASMVVPRRLFQWYSPFETWCFKIAYHREKEWLKGHVQQRRLCNEHKKTDCTYISMHFNEHGKWALARAAKGCNSRWTIDNNPHPGIQCCNWQALSFQTRKNPRVAHEEGLLSIICGRCTCLCEIGLWAGLLYRSLRTIGFNGENSKGSTSCAHDDHDERYWSIHSCYWVKLLSFSLDGKKGEHRIISVSWDSTIPEALDGHQLWHQQMSICAYPWCPRKMILSLPCLLSILGYYRFIIGESLT